MRAIISVAIIAILCICIIYIDIYILLPASIIQTVRIYRMGLFHALRKSLCI